MERKHWLDESGNVRLLWRLFLVVLALTVVAELLVTLHPYFAVVSIFAFHAWFGFLSCAAMIGAAIAIGQLLKRPDTYYGREDD